MGILSYGYKAKNTPLGKKVVEKVKNFFKGKKTSKTITSTTPNVGNLKFNQGNRNKLIKTTDAYVTKAGSVDPGLKKALRDAGSKSLQGDKILRKNKKYGGRMGKMGGGMMGRRFGMKKGSSKGKVPTTPKEKAFGMLSVKKGLDSNKNITFTDKIAGAKKA